MVELSCLVQLSALSNWLLFCVDTVEEADEGSFSFKSASQPPPEFLHYFDGCLNQSRVAVATFVNLQLLDVVEIAISYQFFHVLLVDTAEDEGVSGSSANRNGFILLFLVKEADFLWLADLSLLSRHKLLVSVLAPDLEAMDVWEAFAAWFNLGFGWHPDEAGVKLTNRHFLFFIKHLFPYLCLRINN